MLAAALRSQRRGSLRAGQTVNGRWTVSSRILTRINLRWRRCRPRDADAGPELPASVVSACHGMCQTASLPT